MSFLKQIFCKHKKVSLKKIGFRIVPILNPVTGETKYKDEDVFAQVCIRCGKIVFELRGEYGEQYND